MNVRARLDSRREGAYPSSPEGVAVLRGPFLLLLAMMLPACAPNEALVDAAFCDQGEPCFDIGSGGSGGGVTTGGTDPGEFECGGIVCADEVPMGACVTEWICLNGHTCAATEAGASGYQDLDSCTVDACGANGEWTHRPITASEMSDGDPCTVDSCAPDTGVIHQNTCG